MARAYNGLKTVSSINGFGRNGLVHAKKNETTTIYQNKLKRDKRLKYKSWYHKNLRRKDRSKISDISIAIFLLIYLLGQGKQGKNKQMRLHQI